MQPSPIRRQRRRDKRVVEKGVSKPNIAKIYCVSWPCVNHFIKTRKLNLSKIGT